MPGSKRALSDGAVSLQRHRLPWVGAAEGANLRKVALSFGSHRIRGMLRCLNCPKASNACSRRTLYARILGKLSAGTFASRLQGAKLVAVRRHGKHLMANVDRDGWLAGLPSKFATDLCTSLFRLLILFHFAKSFASKDIISQKACSRLSGGALDAVS